MVQKQIFKFCRDLGCCDACSLRYLGLKNPKAYGDSREFALKFQDRDKEEICNKTQNTVTKDKIPDDTETESCTQPVESKSKTSEVVEPETQIPEVSDSKSTPEISESSKNIHSNGTSDTIAAEPSEIHENGDEPPSKKQKTEICPSCIGILQESTWPEAVQMVQEVLDEKGYVYEEFACALSAPLATLLRERAVALLLQEKFPEYDLGSVTPLKEAWKWSFGAALAGALRRQLASGAVAPLLVSLTYSYSDEAQELEVVRELSPAQFAARSRQRRYAERYTRPAVEEALRGAGAARLRGARGWAPAGLRAAGGAARCQQVAAQRAPLYLAGRYIKLSRELPQTPWVVRGERVMPSSVQEVICAPVADACGIPPSECERRLKLIAAGREDVDVRCLGDGRPFALEIADPRRELTAAELRLACERIARSGSVLVHSLVPITRDDLALLKKGEETKCKTYEALCIKLTHSQEDIEMSCIATTTDSAAAAGPVVVTCEVWSLCGQGLGAGPVAVTARDLAALRSWRNTPPAAAERIALTQRTPVRVLHRRPLLARTRHILELDARPVEGHPALLVLVVRTSAGAYVKEWAHGELARTKPALPDLLGARTDILALDVRRVHLDWPPAPAAGGQRAGGTAGGGEGIQ